MLMNEKWKKSVGEEKILLPKLSTVSQMTSSLLNLMLMDSVLSH